MVFDSLLAYRHHIHVCQVLRSYSALDSNAKEVLEAYFNFPRILRCVKLQDKQSMSLHDR